MPWRIMATRSMPRPKAKPRDLLGVVDRAGPGARSRPRTPRGAPCPSPGSRASRCSCRPGSPCRRSRCSRGRPRPRARCRGRTRAGSAPGTRAEERVQEGLDRALEVAQGDARADHQPLDLLEHRRVGDVVVAPEDLARADDPHLGRVRVLEHVADLADEVWVRSTTPARPRQVEGVLHVAGRVVRRHVEGLEAVVVVLHLAAVVDLVAHGDEDVLELLAHRGQGVAPARGRGRGRAG